MRLRSVVRVVSLVAAAASSIAAVASCDGESAEPMSTTPLPDASQPPAPVVVVPRDASEQPTDPGPSDAGVPNDGYPSDVYDSAPSVGSCSSFPMAVCNFEEADAGGVCPPIAGIIFGPPGPGPSSLRDAGPDGSTAFRAIVGDGGGRGQFGMPFFDFSIAPDPLVSISHCQVVCEANLRLLRGSGNVTLIEGDERTWTVDLLDGGYTHRTASAAGASIAVSDSWTHVKIRMLPNGTAATSEVTIGDASASTVAVSKLGRAVRFGVAANGPTDGAEVLIDDVTCQVSDAPTPPPP